MTLIIKDNVNFKTYLSILCCSTVIISIVLGVKNANAKHICCKLLPKALRSRYITEAVNQEDNPIQKRERAINHGVLIAKAI